MPVPVAGGGPRQSKARDEGLDRLGGEHESARHHDLGSNLG